MHNLLICFLRVSPKPAIYSGGPKLQGDSINAFYDATTHLSHPITFSVLETSAVAVVLEGSKRHRRVGYWGDVLTGPFPALALASADPRAAKTQNGYNVHVRKYLSAFITNCNLTNTFFFLIPVYMSFYGS